MKESIGAKTIVLPTPAWVVGSYDKQGRPNVMTVAWGGICCSKPPCIAVSLRKATYTYGNIMERQAFTVNVPSESLVKETDFFGISTYSGKKVDKFAASGLTPIKSDLVDAPYVAEYPLVLECKVLQSIEIGLHTQFIGEIMDVKADQDVLVDGYPDIEKVRPLVFSPVRRVYHGVGNYIGDGFSVGKEIGERID